MRRRSDLSAVVFMCVIVVSVTAVATQGAGGPATLRQIAYLKASNPGMFDLRGGRGA